jgi:tRNA threonylcarbamoyladenosine biosynthesis protein TsaB
MNLLAIDTSTTRASIALKIGDEVVTADSPEERQHALVLLPKIEALLATLGHGFSSLDGLIFGSGPGSFTGLRIACSMAKGLALACDLPLYAVGSLDVIADAAFAKSPDYPVLAMMDARMSQYYWAYYSKPMTEAEPFVSDPSEIIQQYDALTMAGVGLDAYRSALPEALIKSVQFTDEIYPDAARMIARVECLKPLPVDVALASPYYVRNKVTHGG